MCARSNKTFNILLMLKTFFLKYFFCQVNRQRLEKKKFCLLQSNELRLRPIWILQLRINKIDNFSDFGFISSQEFKIIKVFETITQFRLNKKGSDIQATTSGRRRAPFKGLQVILQLRVGTDLVQPILVVRDSCVKGQGNKLIAHLLHYFNIQ